MTKLSKASKTWVELEFSKSKNEPEKRIIVEMKQIAAAIKLGLNVDYSKNLELVGRLKDLVQL